MILSYFKKKFQEKLLVFPINVDLEEKEPVIKILKRRYGVEALPSIVVEDVVFDGVVGRTQLASEICLAFDEFDETCLEFVEE